MGIGTILSGLFGGRGLAGTVTDTLKGLGILKDPKQELLVLQAMQKHEAEIQDKLTRRIESVNQTMQAESRSEHWAQWSWRPFVGYTFAFTIINNYIVMPYFSSVKAVEIPANVWLAMLTVLGAAAYTRGKEKTERAKK